MARPTNANLELGKARKSNAALELNPAHVVRLLAVLQATVVVGQEGTIAATVPAPTPAIQARVVIVANMASTLHPVIPGMAAEYDINVFRGPSSEVAGDWQQADLLTDAVAEQWELAANQPVTLAADWQEGMPYQGVSGWTFDQAPRCYQLGSADWQEGPALGTSHGQTMESLPPGHAMVSGLWVEAEDCGQWHLSGYTHPPRGDKDWTVRWQEAVRLGRLLGGGWDLGVLLHLNWLDGWDEAIWPLPGTSPPPKPPIKPEKRKLRLAFGRPRGDASLEFVWFGQDAAYVIPTRRVYLVSNTASVVRVRDGLDIPATAVNIELDTDSWAWQFSAQIPRIAAAALTDDATSTGSSGIACAMAGSRPRALAGSRPP